MKYRQLMFYVNLKQNSPKANSSGLKQLAEINSDGVLLSCLLLQQKCNKTVQVKVTIIPRQPGKELSVAYNQGPKNNKHTRFSEFNNPTILISPPDTHKTAKSEAI